MEAVTRLGKGNLNSHATKLETAGCFGVLKVVRGRTRATSCRLTEPGSEALRRYWERMGAAGGMRTRA